MILIKFFFVNQNRGVQKGPKMGGCGFEKERERHEKERERERERESTYMHDCNNCITRSCVIQLHPD